MTTALDGTGQARYTAPDSLRTRISARLRAYVSLTKPRVVELLLVITAPVMILAAHADHTVPHVFTVLATLVGGSLSAGAANAFNCVIDRDIDRVMHRTRSRPLVTGALTTRQAVVFAVVLTLVSSAVLLVFTTWLAAVLALAAVAFYVFVYTLWLKRRTEQNIIWGGIAGCFPVLIGWAAQTGTLSWSAFVLFMVIFLWTPPHYWPLSMKYRDDYASVNVPMLGVVRSRPEVGLQTVLYAWATVACSLLLIPIAHVGPLYGIVALVAGGWFVWETHRLYSAAINGTTASPMRVFHASIGYLTLLFLAIAIDPLIFTSGR